MKIHEFLTNKSQWTQGHFARGVDGIPLINPKNPFAVSWCLMGLVKIIYNETLHHTIYQMITRELMTNDYNDLADWNDDPKRTFEDIKSLVTKLNI